MHSGHRLARAGNDNVFKQFTNVRVPATKDNDYG